jgi:hypothetical protein
VVQFFSAPAWKNSSPTTPNYQTLGASGAILASRHARGRINHDAHLAGAVAGIAFVALTDPAALARAVRVVIG